MRPAKVASRPSRHAGRWPRSPPASASSSAQSTLGAEGHGRCGIGWTESFPQTKNKTTMAHNASSNKQ